MTSVSYRTPSAADLTALCRLGRATFIETFGDLYPPEDLEDFLHHTFGPPGMPNEFANPAYRFRIAESEGQMIGYCKLGPASLPAPEDGRQKIELRQLYVLRPWQGAGVAASLMNWAMGVAKSSKADDFYLSVFSENVRAQRFYSRYGFQEVGRFHYMVGKTADDERLWRLQLR